MPAISSKGASDSPNTSSPEALVHASGGSLGACPAENWEQAAGLFAGVAKLLSPGLTTSGMDRESRSNLVQKLAEWEVRLRNCGPDGNDSLKAALAGVEDELRAWRRPPGAVQPPGQKPAHETGGEGTAGQTPSAANGMDSNQASPPVAEPPLGGPEKDVAALAGKLENVCDDVPPDFAGEGGERDGRARVVGAERGQGIALETPVRDLTGGAQTIRDHGGCAASPEQFDRLAREFQRSSTQLEAATTYRPLFEGHGAANRVPETFPAPSVEQGGDDALARQIEILHRQLAARLEPGVDAGAIEMNTLKDLAGGGAKKTEPMRDPGQRERASAALEREIAKLAGRLDHPGEGLASLAALERSIGDLSGQLEETRRLMSGLSDAAGPPAGVPEPSNGPGSFEDAQSVMREIADLRALHEETAQRAQLALTAIQASVEQVACRCARLEAAGGVMRPDRRGAGAAPADPFAPVLAYLAQHGEDASLAVKARLGSNENPPAGGAFAGAGVEGAGKLQPATHGDPAGFLIEPGLGLPGRREHSEPGGQSAPPKISHDRDEGASHTGFIAAARRAARMAQMELHGATPKSLAGDDGRAGPRAFLFGRGRGLFVMHRRPLVVGAAVLFAAIGAYALARTLTLNNLSYFAPDFPRLSGRAAIHAKPAGAASRTSQTLASTTLAQLVASQARQNEAPGGQLPASGPASTMAAMLDPSPAAPAEPSFPFDSATGMRSPATRAITGSDAIVAGSIRPGNVASTSVPPRRPAAALANALPSAALTATPTAPSGDPSTAPGAPAPPAAELSNNLVGQAEAGDAAAQFDLAVHYAEGGTAPPNYALAAQWFDRAAQQGLAVAEYRLGLLYEKGLGVGKDIQRAKDLYQRAAEKGNTRAMYNLGVLAAEGSGGRPNYASAAVWFGKAAEYGVRDSQYNLAVLLVLGLGLPKDLVKSYTWFAIVAAAGDAGAAKKRDGVAAMLTSSELAAANAAAAAFEPQPAGRAANEAAPPPAQPEAAPAQGQPVKPKISGL